MLDAELNEPAVTDTMSLRTCDAQKHEESKEPSSIHVSHKDRQRVPEAVARVQENESATRHQPKTHKPRSCPSPGRTMTVNFIGAQASVALPAGLQRYRAPWWLPTSVGSSACAGEDSCLQSFPVRTAPRQLPGMRRTVRRM